MYIDRAGTFALRTTTTMYFEHVAFDFLPGQSIRNTNKGAELCTFCVAKSKVALLHASKEDGGTTVCTRCHFSIPGEVA